MYISDLLKMSEFRNFRKVTKKSGEKNILTNIGIHDYESIDQIPLSFGKGDFVLTTLFVCKDSKEDMERYINALLDAKISALAIKEIFHEKIPEKCIEKADIMNIPILFYPTHIYAEDIIVSVKTLINEQNRYKDFEEKVNKLISDKMEIHETKEFIALINKASLNKTGVIYALKKRYDEKKVLGDCKSLEDKIKAFPIKNEIYLGKYEEGIMLFINYSDNSKCKSILKSLLNMFNKDDYWVGYELNYEKQNPISESILNALNSSSVASIEKVDLISYDEIGIYKMILPLESNKGMIKQCNEFIKMIKEHDEKYNSFLFETAARYVDNEGDIISTAREMHQHPNTVRYRINKLKQLFDNHNDGYVELYLTMKVNKANENMRVN